MTDFWHFPSPLGVLWLTAEAQGITALSFDPPQTPAAFLLQPTPLLAAAAAQLQEYFDRQRQTFDLPFLLHGTPFQQATWHALQTIPYGQTCSYQQIAVQLGQPKACRAVGGANHCNPLPILIPCHRVIRQNGSIGGYGGGTNRKIALLELEQRGLRQPPA